jgi:hypothetical protein
MKKKSEKDQALADGAKLRGAWRRWHREQLAEALVGLHRDVMARAMAELKDLRSARELVNFIAAQDWAAVDPQTRSVALHEIAAAIMRLRERSGLAPFDDPLPGQPDNAFRIIRKILTGNRNRGETDHAL